MRKFLMVLLVLALLAAAAVVAHRHHALARWCGHLPPPPPRERAERPEPPGPPLALPIGRECDIHFKHSVKIESKIPTTGPSVSYNVEPVDDLRGKLVKSDPAWVVVTDDNAVEHWISREDIQNIDVFPTP